jgi:hypothetical protein
MSFRPYVRVEDAKPIPATRIRPRATEQRGSCRQGALRPTGLYSYRL